MSFSVVLDLGVPLVGPGTHLFHTETLIFPYGYRCSRFFKIMITVYLLDVILLFCNISLIENTEYSGLAKFQCREQFTFLIL